MVLLLNFFELFSSFLGLCPPLSSLDKFSLFFKVSNRFLNELGEFSKFFERFLYPGDTFPGLFGTFFKTFRWSLPPPFINCYILCGDIVCCLPHAQLAGGILGTWKILKILGILGTLGILDLLVYFVFCGT